MPTIFEIMNAATKRCPFRFDVHAAGVKVVVNSEREAFANALQEYFFMPASPRRDVFPFDGVTLTYSHDNQLFFQALAIAARFRVVERVEFHPDNFYEIIYSDESGEILESRGGLRHLILRSASRQNYCIITPDYRPDVLEFQKPGIRLIREIAFRAYQTLGYFPLHASVASNGSTGFLFVGDSGAGKTTLATVISAIASAGIFVSSDITLLKQEGACVNAVGWPGGGISTGFGTLESLRASTGTFRQDAVLKHEEGYVKKGKVLLTPAEFMKMFKVRIGIQQGIDSIIFPTISLEDDAFQVETLPPETAFELASRQLRNSLSDTHRYGLFDILTTDMQTVNALAIEELEAITKSIPAYAIQGHPISLARHLAEHGNAQSRLMTRHPYQ